jgi:hypothetical protein
MSYSLGEKEPAAVVGGITSLLGFLALLGADVHTLQGLGTALGISGSQSLLTRQAVYSPKWIKEQTTPSEPNHSLTQLLKPGGGAIRQHEPTAAIGVGTLLAGFLVQFFAGVHMTEALATATGIAGVQAAATRGRVYSPASARATVIADIARTGFTHEEQHQALRDANLLPASR